MIYQVVPVGGSRLYILRDLAPVLPWLDLKYAYPAHHLTTNRTLASAWPRSRSFRYIYEFRRAASQGYRE